MKTLKRPIETITTLLKSDGTFKGGAFTVRSKKTGKDLTYKIRKKEWQGGLYIHCYVETQYLEFKYIGTYKNGKLFKSRMENENVTAKGIAWIIDKIFAGAGEVVEASAEIMHLGKCLKCGRTLTDAKSIETGLGSHCRSVLSL